MTLDDLGLLAECLGAGLEPLGIEAVGDLGLAGDRIGLGTNRRGLVPGRGLDRIGLGLGRLLDIVDPGLLGSLRAATREQQADECGGHDPASHLFLPVRRSGWTELNFPTMFAIYTIVSS
ncbi:hypothetical protein PIB19_13275 [Sphingomonas sp. 7/4-4]|uniref:hypothetical protein n=1 Tax=Sphingomonas sp. 7/4-4 TaxID=3018446 RepID=UPI0022F40461|nr:hypothetical protein [Sphingomonas sp. 7/4-4]WBY06546.1 hypothetical protein PIB19_13275 [Sphingomonas sp. 7/4-4]